MRLPARGRWVPLTLVLLFSLRAAAAEEGGSWGPGLRYKNKKAGFEIALTGYGQLDFVSFLDWRDLDPTSSLKDNAFTVRRLRPSIEGKWRRLSFELQGDFADLVESRTNLSAERLRNAWVDYRFAKSLAFRAGNQKVPVSPEWLTSAARIDFIERSRLADRLAPGRDWGVLLHGEVGKRFAYEAGVFLGDDRVAQSRADTTGAARVVWSPSTSLAVGGSFSLGDVAAEPFGPGLEPQHNGLNGKAVPDFDFFKRKFVDGQRRRLGADAAYVRGPFAVKGEFLHLREERLGQGANFEDLPAVIGRGWAFSASWLVTGEKKKRAVKPSRPLFGGVGAVELALRYEDLHFDDEGPGTGFAGVGDRSRNLRPAGDRAFTGGLSWWPTHWMRLMVNVAVERYLDPLLSPEPGRQSNYATLLARFQLELP